MSARRLFTLAAVVVAMYALKRHYSTATVEELRWILAPTRALVGGLSGVSFEFEHGAGYLSRERLFVIEKSCAGLNFMIAALGMTAFVLTRDGRPLAVTLAQSLGVSYSAAVVVNALRILLALRLASMDLASGWWTEPRIHRLEGIVVYFGGLWALDRAARTVLRERPSPGAAEGA